MASLKTSASKHSPIASYMNEETNTMNNFAVRWFRTKRNKKESCVYYNGELSSLSEIKSVAYS